MESSKKPAPTHHVRRAPTHSIWYDRILPVVFLLLALSMFALILFAAAVLVGIVRY